MMQQIPEANREMTSLTLTWISGDILFLVAIDESQVSLGRGDFNNAGVSRTSK
jgi:hypothetical protein